MAHLHALPIGHEFEGYRIERVLGAGGFGITYKATETMIGRAVAIKEYLPSSVAARAVGNLSVHPLAEAEAETYRWGLKRFRNEARTLVSFRHANIVPVYRFFEANGTAYLVMAYEDGTSLAEILKKARTLPEARIRELLDPLLDGVAEVHKAGFLHRDIKPANIVIHADGTPMLIDFGAARQALGAQSQSSKAIVSPGYAPFEQYTSLAEQGPYTDIYALGATFYCCVTGIRPVEAPDRVAGVAMRSASELAAGRYSADLLKAIDRALAIKAEDRPQTIAAWRDELKGQAIAVSDSTLTPGGGKSSLTPTLAQATVALAPRPTRRALQMGLLAGIASLVTLGGYEVVRSQISASRGRAEEEAQKRAKIKEQQERDAAAQNEQQRRADAARQRAEAAAQRGREAQGRAQVEARAALAAQRDALAAKECARQAAQRARVRQDGHLAGQLNNGNRYEGQWNHQKNWAHGCGVLVMTTGVRFEGEFNNGYVHGHAVGFATDGTRYEGAYKNDAIEGYGVFHFRDAEFQARFSGTVAAGPGVWIEKGGKRYEGEFRTNRWSGFGVIRYPNGEIHEGEFADGDRHGLGVSTMPDGKKTYGRWVRGIYAGLGDAA